MEVQEERIVDLGDYRPIAKEIKQSSTTKLVDQWVQGKCECSETKTQSSRNHGAEREGRR